MTSKYKGFTLIELMIVITIISILAMIAIPSYKGYVMEARRSDAFSTLHEMLNKQTLYYGNHNATYTLDVTALGYIATDTNKDSRISNPGNYMIKMEACPNSAGIADCVLLTATVIPDGDQNADTTCQSISLNSQGLKTSTDNTGASSNCWN